MMIQRRSLAGAVALIGLAGSPRLVAAQQADAKFLVYIGEATRWPAIEEYSQESDIHGHLISIVASGGDVGEIALVRSWASTMVVGEEVSVRLSGHGKHGIDGVLRVRRVK
jgi:hypothetical protein